MGFFKNIYHFLLAWLGSVIYSGASKKLFVLGVTGTKGKSTVIELANAVLEAAGKKTAVLSSVRVKVGAKSEKNMTDNTMPGRFFIQRFLRAAVRAGCEYALIEVTSQGVAQSRHRFIDFDAALFLNLHPEHIEAHGSYENYRNAKLKFFSDAARFSSKKNKAFFVNREDAANGYFTDAVHGRGRIYYFGRESFIEHKLARGRIPIGDWLSNNFNLENAAAVSAFAEARGIDWKIIQSTFQKFKGIPGRMDVIQEQPFKVVVDYAHTPDSLELVYRALSVGGQSQRDKGLICVLGSAGGGRDKWKRPALGKVAAGYCKHVILTNEDPYDENPEIILEQIAHGCHEYGSAQCTVETVLDRRSGIQAAVKLAELGDTVVITGKGSESWMHFSHGRRIAWDERAIAEAVLTAQCNK